MNNDSFTVERALELDPTPSYHDIAQLNYNKLPEAFGCKGWLTIKVKSQTQLAQALEQARTPQRNIYLRLLLISMIMDKLLTSLIAIFK